jgi:hypothetical protein
MDRILQAELVHLAKQFPEKSISIGHGHTDLLNLWHTATFGTLPVHTSRLLQRAEASKCGTGCTTSFSEPRAELGEGKRRSCWAGSHPASRSTPPCKNMSREGHFHCPGPHGTYEFVASRNLRDTPNSHFKVAATGRSCKVRHGVHNILLSEPLAERGESKRRSC